MLLPVLVLLAAAPPPPPLLEPDPGTAQRLQPRRVTASSFLQNGWNSYEQNYLPPYIADDDPTTAWVEGVKGRGEGESLLWLGPTLEKAKRYTVFLRSGYQKSEKLYRANARPETVRLEPVVLAENGPVAAGKPVEVKLADQLGWQKITVPTEARVTGLRLTLVTTYPGTSYDDTCISDMRVYVEAGDTYRPDVEAAAEEDIRQFAAERRRAAQAQGRQAHIVLAPSYSKKELLRLENSPLFRQENAGEDNYVTALEQVLASNAKKPELKAALTAAVSSAHILHSVDRNTHDKPMPKEWTRVKTVELHPMPGTAKVALDALNDKGLPRIVPLLHLKDSSFFEADASQAQMLARIEKLEGQEAAGIKACVKECKARYARENREEDPCDCLEQCNHECGETVVTKVQQAKHQLDAGDFILGPMAQPSNFLRADSEITGSREPSLYFRQTLVSYQGERASVVSTAVDAGEAYVLFVAHVLEWEQLPDGRSHLKAVISVSMNEQQSLLTVTRYEAT